MLPREDSALAALSESLFLTDFVFLFLILKGLIDSAIIRRNEFSFSVASTCSSLLKVKLRIYIFFVSNRSHTYFLECFLIEFVDRYFFPANTVVFGITIFSFYSAMIGKCAENSCSPTSGVILLWLTM